MGGKNTKLDRGRFRRNGGIDCERTQCIGYIRELIRIRPTVSTNDPEIVQVSENYKFPRRDVIKRVEWQHWQELCVDVIQNMNRKK